MLIADKLRTIEFTLINFGTPELFNDLFSKNWHLYNLIFIDNNFLYDLFNNLDRNRNLFDLYPFYKNGLNFVIGFGNCFLEFLQDEVHIINL